MSLRQLIGLTLRGEDHHVLGRVVDVVFVPVAPGPAGVPLHRVEGGLVALAMVKPAAPDADPMVIEITQLEHDPSGEGIIPTAPAS